MWRHSVRVLSARICKGINLGLWEETYRLAGNEPSFEVAFSSARMPIWSRPARPPLLESVVLTGEPARLARGTGARSSAGDRASVVNRRGWLFTAACERARSAFALRKKGANSSECRLVMGWRWFSSTVRKNRPGVRWRLAKHCKITRASGCGWEFTAVRSIESPM